MPKAIPHAALWSMERVDTGTAPRSGEPEMAVELLGDTWSDVAIPATPPEVSHPSRDLPEGKRWSIARGASSTAGRPPQCAAVRPYHSTSCIIRSGRHMVQMLREALDAHLTTTLAQLMPHLLDTVRDVVQAKMPDLLEVLLQQEIDKLKQAVEQDQPMPKPDGAHACHVQGRTSARYHHERAT